MHRIDQVIHKTLTKAQAGSLCNEPEHRIAAFLPRNAAPAAVERSEETADARRTTSRNFLTTAPPRAISSLWFTKPTSEVPDRMVATRYRSTRISM